MLYTKELSNPFNVCKCSNGALKFIHVHLENIQISGLL
jgi:hypothetical protein